MRGRADETAAATLMSEDHAVLAACKTLSDRVGSRRPEIAIVLGSGLGRFIERLRDPIRISWGDLPGFARPGVQGHAGDLVAGLCDGRPVLCQCGRLHAYEGHILSTVAFPIRVYAALGVHVLIVTNAAGGIRTGLEPGSLMLLADQINFTFRNPLIGPVVDNEVRFPDMSAAYDAELRAQARDVARGAGIELHEGVYAGVVGPSYETPAEIGMLARAGADAVGMSTVSEVVTARARGLRCLGLSTITNRASGLGPCRLSHEEVIRVSGEAAERLGRLVTGVVTRVGVEADGAGPHYTVRAGTV
jgi:purine-nucleoside phosphorylase